MRCVSYWFCGVVYRVDNVDPILPGKLHRGMPGERAFTAYGWSRLINRRAELAASTDNDYSSR
jgi:hypothetical protein